MTEELETIVENFNKHYPAGTEMLYWPVGGPYRCTAQGPFQTCGPAFIMGGHSVMVQLEGKSGSFSLDHCTPYVPQCEHEWVPEYDYLTCKHCHIARDHAEAS